MRKVPSSVLLGVANLTDVATALIRGIILARLLSPEQFGLAITISVVGSVVEMITDVGLIPLAVRSANIRELNTLHSIALGRALAIGTLIAVSGPIFGWVFNSPNASSAYIIVGIATIIRGCANLDADRRTRVYDYAPKVISLIASQITWTVIAAIYAYYTNDFRSMAVGVLSYMIVYVLCTHLLAKHGWRLGWDRQVARDAWSYGRPLALNGFATAVYSLGDRAITGSQVGLVQLAHYTALSTSALLPRAALVRYLGSVYTPHFMNAVDTKQKKRVAELWVITVACIGGTFGIGFTAFGQPAIEFVYGKNYHVEQTLISLIALLGTIRYMGCLPTPPALAYGANALLARFTSLSTLGLMIGAGLLLVSKKLEFLLAGMCIGEFLALMWLVYRITGILALKPTTVFQTLGMPVAAVLFNTLILYASFDSTNIIRYLSSLLFSMILLFLLFLFLKSHSYGVKDVIRALVPRKAQPIETVDIVTSSTG